MDFITFKHSFNAGDLITVLPGIKHICEKNNTKAIIYQRLNLLSDYGHNDSHPVTHAGKQVCMNWDIFRMIKPLVESLDYVERFCIWEGERVQFDYDKTRQHSQMPLPGGSIHKWPSLIYPQLECDLSSKWIDIPVPDGTKLSSYVKVGGSKMLTLVDGSIVINRTHRYTNPYITYFFLKEHEGNILFAGTPEEHSKFMTDWGLDSIPFIIVDNFHELAMIINRCKLFIGNQSLCWHLADAMKVPRILEVCTQYPNTFPTGRDGYSFITQEALEFRFHKLLNESNVRTSQSNLGDS